MNKTAAIAGITVAIIIIIAGVVVAFEVYRMPGSPFAPPPVTTSSTSLTSTITTRSSSLPQTTSSSTSSSSSSSISTSSSSSSSSSSSTTSSSSSSSSTTPPPPPPPPPPGSGTPKVVPTGQGGSGNITVYGENLNGTAAVNYIAVDLRVNGNSFFPNGNLPGMPVTFTGLKFGVAYGVVIYWYGNNYIRYINDSNTGLDLQRYDLVTLSQSRPSDTLFGVFEYVPPSQAGQLNIVAQFANPALLKQGIIAGNGTWLGTAQVVNGYDLHSPGMWLTVTPPFRSTPYTGTFTGGSILPFTFFNHETYIVQMSLGYCGPWVTNLTGTGPTVYVAWVGWQNDSSRSSSRSITLNGSQTYMAIYNQVSSCPSGLAPTSSTFAPSMPAIFGLLTVIGLALASPGLARISASKVLKASMLSNLRHSFLRK